MAAPSSHGHHSCDAWVVTATFLIADDEAQIRQSLRALSIEEGFDVNVAASGAEAWARFQETRPDVVLQDLVLGETDAVGLFERYRWPGNIPELRSFIARAAARRRFAAPGSPPGGADGRRRGRTPARPPMFRAQARRSPRWERWSLGTSVACWRSAGATAHWPPNNSVSPDRRWRRRSMRDDPASRSRRAPSSRRRSFQPVDVILQGRPQ